MKTNTFLLLTLLVIQAATVKSQDTSTPLNPACFTVYSVSVSSSWYQPQMDYWNDAYLPLSNVTDRFGGNFSVGGHIVLSLPRDFRARIGVSYWSDQAKGNDQSAIQSLRISLTRFRLAAIYAPKPFCFAGLQPYLGAEGQFLVINNKRKDATRITRQEGQDYSFGPLIGMERSFNHFTAGLEFMYNLGSYTQDLVGGTNRQVSVSGPEVSLSIGYKF